MMKIRLRENHDVLVAEHPLKDSLNKKLLKEIEEVEFSNPKPTIVNAAMSDFRTHTRTMSFILEWIESLIRANYKLPHYEFGLEFYNSWYIKYEKGDKTNSHQHIPAAFSFVYYIQTPKGSSPMIFTHTGKRVKAEAGKAVIFPGNVYHHVPKNKCSGRIVLSGHVTAHFCSGNIFPYP